MKFASEGFDLSQAKGDNDVLELAPNDDVMEAAEACKAQGNECFQRHEWSQAYDCYSEAIAATPGGPKGDELLRLKQEWEEEQSKKWREQLREYDAAKIRQAETDGEEEKKKEDTPPPQFQPPPHPHGAQLAVYYSNRAAASLQMALMKKDDNADASDHHQTAAIEDCTIALLLHPTYVKALVRRSTAYERQENTEQALVDAKAALALEQNNSKLRLQVQRLQQREDERLEKLKAETMDQLKDLGNSLLGNFGLSLDNFKTVQDPNTGSYSISFQNN